MQEIITKLFNRDKKKVSLRDVVSPKPSKSAARVLSEVLRRAYADQQAVSQKAQEIRAGN